MHLRSSILAGAAVVAMTGFAFAQSVGPSTVPNTQAPPNTVPSATAAAPAATTTLDNVQSPKTTLAGAKVKDAKGEAIGEVKTVSLDANGKVSAVTVDAGGKMLTLKAETLTYAQADNTLISSQTRTEIGAH